MSSSLRWLGFVAGFATLAFMVLLSARGLKRVSADTGWVDHTHEVLTNIASVRLLVSDASSNRRGLATNFDQTERDRYGDSQHRIDLELARLASLVRDNPDQEIDAERLQSLLAQWRSILQNSIAEQDRSGFVLSVQSAFSEQARLAAEAVHDLARRMSEKENQLLVVREEEARASAESTRRVVIAGNSLGLLVLIGATTVTALETRARRRGESEINRLNEELTQHAAQLETANKELEAFSYSVSHDLRAPLRAIDGFSQALLEESGDRLDETGRRYLGRVRAGAQRMAELIDDLLSLSRVSTKSLDRSTVDLSEIAAEVFGVLARAEPDRKVAFEGPGRIQAEADEGLIRLVLQNLIGNAWKFTARREDAEIEFGVRDGNGRPQYFVHDNGAGFDMAYAGKLFGAFQRLHTEGEFPGTGIGLATVARIIHRHGGSVGAEGRVGEGATFWFTL